MSETPRNLEELAARVADGVPVDWDQALKGATSDADRRVVRQLQLMQSVARVHVGTDLTAPIPEDAGGAAAWTGTWGHLELREKLSEGSYGELFRAWDPNLDRDVALKLLKPSRAALERSLASVLVEEGRLLAKIRHPNVVTVYGADTHAGRAGLWMELIRGRSLEELVHAQGLMGAREAALVGVDLCRAIAAVHGAGIVHRDVKAQNAMREEGGRIVLMDFGAGLESRLESAAPGARITGTPFYMAPELLHGRPATPVTDLYALGVLLYRLVTGRFPLEAASWDELLKSHASGGHVLLRDARPGLPESFVAVVERATDPDPARRFATAGQMEQALAQVSGAGTAVLASDAPGAGAPSRASRVALIAFGIVAIAATTAALLWHPRPPAPAVVTSGTVAPAPAAPASPGPAPYTVTASVYRVAAGASVRERVQPGTRLALGDRVTLEFEASTPLHVYVVNEDEAGHAYALFPLPGLDERNPLAPGVVHLLPGARAGKPLAWTVDSPGGREHLLVLASERRLAEYEAEMSRLARPGQTAVALPEAARLNLRGLGTLSESPVASTQPSASRLFELAQRLASGSETVSGVWMRRIDLENPRP